MATASFVTYLRRNRELPVPEFRAPPPSPVTGVLTGSSSGSSGYGGESQDDEIGRFLRCSARPPELRLPDGALRRRRKKKAAWTPPVIDMRQLDSPVAGGEPAVEALNSAAVAFGCFQVVGHGVQRDLVSAALRVATTREEGWSTSKEMDGIGDGDEDGEELWWPPGEGDDNMAGNSPMWKGANQFRSRADELFTQLEEISTKLIHALQQGSAAADTTGPLAEADTNGSLLCIRKHHREQRNGSFSSGPLSQNEVVLMLVRESRYSRALALHLCPGASAFHVFSRRGWSRFRPLDGAAVVTVGDQLQEWSRGLYKSMSGRPAYSSDDIQGDGSDDAVSAEFFHSCSPADTAKEATYAGSENVVPLNLQVMAAAGLVLVYRYLSSFLYAAA